MARTNSGIANVTVIRPSVPRSLVSMTDRCPPLTAARRRPVTSKVGGEGAPPPQSNDCNVHLFDALRAANVAPPVDGDAKRRPGRGPGRRVGLGQDQIERFEATFIAPPARPAITSRA